MSVRQGGKRYELRHGRFRRDAAVRLVARPFEGPTGECDWVAMRQIVPAATAPVAVRDEFGGGDVTIVTVLPMAWPALHRADGTDSVAPQTTNGPGDPSRDVAAALLRARETAASNPVTEVGLPDEDPRLQDVLADELHHLAACGATRTDSPGSDPAPTLDPWRRIVPR